MATKNSTPRYAPVIDRIESLICRIPFSGCWIFTGTCLPKGYGTIRIGRQGHYVHRLMYQHFVGPIPDGLFVCHTCDVPACCNPRHLFVGTVKDNAVDMVKKGRAKGKARFGTENPNLKVDVDLVRQVIAAKQQGKRLKTIAKELGVTLERVRAYLYGKDCWIWLRQEMGYLPTKGRRGRWCTAPPKLQACREWAGAITIAEATNEHSGPAAPNR